jgi:two-component system CheB/CheR fusion protein
MTEAQRPDGAEQDQPNQRDTIFPNGYQQVPVVALGGSAGSIEALQEFFSVMPAQSGLAFVVVIHLSPEHQSMLTEVLQRCTRMPVVQVLDTLKVEAGVVYVIPPNRTLRLVERELVVAPIPEGRGKHVVVDIMFRSLADSHGAHAAAVVLSGLDGDGAIGIKRIKERGGLTIAQDPEQAPHGSMPRTSIDTGMVDWVLPVKDIPGRLLSYFRLEKSVTLPPEDAVDAEGRRDDDEAALRDVLNFLRTRTGRDFSSYKRATVLRRIGRRMQVNGTDNLVGYLACLRTRPGEANALLQDLLISVTNFFRDPECFDALALHIPALFEEKGPNDSLRVWVPACATGEEAYSIAILLAEHARTLTAPPIIQVFATDLDEEAIHTARDGVYPDAIVADVGEDRLQRYFVRDHRGWRVRREIRELVLFAVHDVLRDSPFSRLDLASCRNLLIYLTRDAQARVFDTLHFSLLPNGKLFIGSSESVDETSPLFALVDKKHRIYARRQTTRHGIPLPAAQSSLQRAQVAQLTASSGPVIGGLGVATQWQGNNPREDTRRESRAGAWGDVHLQLLERLAPPSVLVNADHDIVHLSASAGRFLQLAGGEPSRNLLHAVHPDVRIELRGALVQAAQHVKPVDVPPLRLPLPGGDALVALRVVPTTEAGESLFLVLFESHPEEVAESRDRASRLEADPLARHLDREIERLKIHLRDTVEQYEASTEELKASNEELQAMNEEMRAASEELETSREELQSINEELTTVNHELKTKVDLLSHANSDMQNLMDATQIATVFLDRELRITRYTPAAVSLFNLIPSDVGRPLTDMATQLDYPELGNDAQQVLQRLVPVEREVGQAGGDWYLARLMPYRTSDDRIAGVVFTFIDITERKQAEEMRRWLAVVVSSTTDAIISFALDGTILSWNNGAQQLFGYAPAEAIGKPVTVLDGPSQPQILGDVAAGRTVSLEAPRRRKDGSEVHVALTISPILDDDGRAIAGTALARDVTARRAATEALRQSEERLRMIVENAVEYAIFATDLERRITTWNPGAERLLGYGEREALGQSADIIFTPEDRKAGGPEKEARTAFDRGRAADERHHMRKDGSTFRGSGVMMLMRDGQGRPTGFLKILRDLSRYEPEPR